MLLRQPTRLLRRTGLFSTAVEPRARLEEFRTSENDPRNHSIDHIGKFYTIEPQVKQTLFKHGGITRTYALQAKTFNETCLMIRNPAIEVINYIKNTDFSRPVNRYVLYGELGGGKSMTMAHLLHYGQMNDFLIVHVPWLPYWYKHPKSEGPSATQEGMVDLPIQACAWLLHFKTQNADLLAKLDLKTSKDYVWSKREETPAGSKLLELIDHGINRGKYAADVIKTLLDEIKQQSTEGKVRTMVALDGYNAIFYEKTDVRGPVHLTRVPPSGVTLTQPFLDIINHDWCNGVVILTVDQLGMTGWQRESDLPIYLLGRKGFEHLDPFIPIRVEPYNEKEFDSCIAYYVNRKWIQSASEGFDKELEFLSNKNPYKLMDMCKSL